MEDLWRSAGSLKPVMMFLFVQVQPDARLLQEALTPGAPENVSSAAF